MAKMLKMSDLPIGVALKVFEMLNEGKVTILEPNDSTIVQYFVYTDTEPKELVYPEGWYYSSKGYFTNKHHSTTGQYSIAYMRTTEGDFWKTKVNYTTP